MITPTFALLALLASTIQPAAAWFRIPCGSNPLVHERIDPIVSFDKAPAQHMHTVQGGSNFFANSTYESLRSSSCTSCLVTDDRSVYWYPRLFFQDPQTGKFEAVPNGGADIYYLFRGNAYTYHRGPGIIKAFPNGLKMLAGDASRRSRVHAVGDRSSQAALAEEAIQWQCYPAVYDYKVGGGFPNSKCQALRADLHFPSCWDGKNLDSPNHRDHVAYLSGLDDGDCPDTHPVLLPHLFFETFWDVNAFDGRWDGTKWPFVWSTGDPTGYSFHGDFMSGWDETLLQNALDQCDTTPVQQSGNVDACTILNKQSLVQAAACKAAVQVDDGPTDVRDALPGCNPIQPGPGSATLYTDANCPIQPGSGNGTPYAMSSSSPPAMSSSTPPAMSSSTPPAMSSSTPPTMTSSTPPTMTGPGNATLLNAPAPGNDTLPNTSGPAIPSASSCHP